MKKTILAAIIVLTLFSCSKEKSAPVKKLPEVLQFRASAVSIDGTIQYSKIVTVTLN